MYGSACLPDQICTYMHACLCACVRSRISWVERGEANTWSLFVRVPKRGLGPQTHPRLQVRRRLPLLPCLGGPPGGRARAPLQGEAGALEAPDRQHRTGHRAGPRECARALLDVLSLRLFRLSSNCWGRLPGLPGRRVCGRSKYVLSLVPPLRLCVVFLTFVSCVVVCLSTNTSSMRVAHGQSDVRSAGVSPNITAQG